MIVVERSGDIIKTYSDCGKMIHGGQPPANYAVAYDPVEANRSYEEIDEYIPTQEDIPPQPRRVFSRLYLELAIAKLGLIEQFDALLKSIEIEPGYTEYRAFERANEISERFPHFDEYIEVIKRELELTDQQVEEVLSASVMTFGNN